MTLNNTNKRSDYGGSNTENNLLSTVTHENVLQVGVYCSHIGVYHSQKQAPSSLHMGNNDDPSSTMDDSDNDLPKNQTNQQPNLNLNSPNKTTKTIKSKKRKYREKQPTKNQALQHIKNFVLQLWLSVTIFIILNS
jgi:hypothetical protein